MDTFSTFNRRVRLAILLSSTLILLLAFGLLLFGKNHLGHENELIDRASEATRADMLYIHPEGH